MSEWKEYKLGDIADIIGGGTPSTIVSEYWNGNVPWLTPKDLTGYKSIYINKGERNITEEGLKKSSARLLPVGTVLLTSRAPIGYVAIAKNEICTNQGFKSLVLNKKIANNLFIYYWIKNNVDYLQSVGSGTTFAEISGNVVKDLDILLPTIEEQKIIASILSSLDDKIALLHRQNKTLESMAETIFRQFFIEESEEDWEEVELEYVSKKITDGSHYSPQTVELGLPMASVKDMHQWGININSCRKISEQDFTNLVNSDCKPLKNDIIIAKDGSYLKHIFVAQKDLDVVILSSIAIIRTNEKYSPLLLAILLKMDLIREELESIVTGGVIPRIVLKSFRKFKILLPPLEKQKESLKIIEPIYLRCWNNIDKIITLEKMRDNLLPKLMNGEIRVEQDLKD